MNNIYRLAVLPLGEMTLISQESYPLKNRPDYQHKIHKLLFFIVREGWKRTYKKIRSKQQNEKNEGTQYLTVISGLYEGKKIFNFSTQFSTDPADFVIDNKFYPLSDIAFAGILKEYGKLPEFFNQFNPPTLEFPSVQLPVHTTLVQQPIRSVAKGVFIVGLGDYSRTYIAPHLRNQQRLGCIDYNVNLATTYKEQFGFKKSYLTVDESFTDFSKVEQPLVIIASYHSDHTRIAKEYHTLNSGAFLFIEKPPCVTLEDVQELIGLYNAGARFEVGFNRRHIPFNKKIASHWKDQIKIITISIKEVNINSSHWYFWGNQGTRITGNLVHWIDLCNFWINGVPEEISLLKSKKEKDTLALAINYSDGSLVNISVSDAGNSLRGVQEFIEIRMEDETIHIDDYTAIKHIKKNGSKKTIRHIRRNKGHDTMYRQLLKWYEGGSIELYPAKDLVITSLVTIFASQMFVNDIAHMKIKDQLDHYLNLLKR